MCASFFSAIVAVVTSHAGWQINGDAAENLMPRPHCDAGEFTSTHIVPIHRLEAILAGIVSAMF
jgi:hypothetical protein